MMTGFWVAMLAFTSLMCGLGAGTHMALADADFADRFRRTKTPAVGKAVIYFLLGWIAGILAAMISVL